jgi:hypothetical protein
LVLIERRYLNSFRFLWLSVRRELCVVYHIGGGVIG